MFCACTFFVPSFFAKSNGFLLIQPQFYRFLLLFFLPEESVYRQEYHALRKNRKTNLSCSRIREKLPSEKPVKTARSIGNGVNCLEEK